VEHDRPAWLENARIPVLVGGHVGFIAAYVIGLFTIFHVARAYKKLEIKVRLPGAAVALLLAHSWTIHGPLYMGHMHGIYMGPCTWATCMGYS
jgi:hypothetical protein